MTNALSIENIEVIYNHSVQALRGLSIAVPAGRIVALLGANGAGKTSTLKAASGVLPFENGRVAAGRVHFFGEDVAARPAHELARMGMAHVREGRHIFADLTVDENLIAAGQALRGRRRGDLGVGALLSPARAGASTGRRGRPRAFRGNRGADR